MSHEASNEEAMAADLNRSGLKPIDIFAHILTNPERARLKVGHSVKGYVIPYYDINGKILPFFRSRIFDEEIKYKQPKETGNHVYFPPNFMVMAKRFPKYVFITEGEKKAALATKLGFPCVAFGGVDSWRTRTIFLPRDSEVSGEVHMQVRLPAHEQALEDFNSPYATGLSQLIDFIVRSGRKAFIIYDSEDGKVAIPVQKAAANLAFELRFQGIDYVNIRQIVLPCKKGKMGLDDFLMERGSEGLHELVVKNLTHKAAFPNHPEVLEYISQRLQANKLTRKEQQQVAMAIISELDTDGIRLRSPNAGYTYYFDYKTHQLMRVEFSADNSHLFETRFGQHLYKKFGIGSADRSINTWLATLYTGESPLEDVDPYRVFARPDKTDDACILQLDDGRFIRVDGRGASGSDHSSLPGLEIYDNGELGILFEAGQVQDVDASKLVGHYSDLNEEYPDVQPFWWGDVLSDVRLRDKDKQRIVCALLFYISPWLYRWRGTQLPVELILGEAGSGKSTLCELRLSIITGDPRLRNMPPNIRDWFATIQHAGGMLVMDNVVFAQRDLRQQISDELCRIITEPNPTVELRKLYSDADVYRIPVRTTFSMTAIAQPFQAQDIIQRSIIIELDKSLDIAQGNLTYNSSWMTHQLKRFGGREAWLAHHLLVLNRFFRHIQQKGVWRNDYPAKHRLINFEQCLVNMATIFGIDGSWIPDYLLGVSARSVVESDLAFEGLCFFANMVRGWKSAEKRNTLWIARELAEWFQSSDDYDKCEMLINPRKLGRYMSSHKTPLAQMAGIIETGSLNNASRWKVVEPSGVFKKMQA